MMRLKEDTSGYGMILDGMMLGKKKKVNWEPMDKEETP